MIEVTVETGTYGGGWQYKNSADCEPEQASSTARVLWDESYTGIQGCRRRITYKRHSDGSTASTEERP